MALKTAKGHYALAIIFFLVFACRLFYAFQTPYLSGAEDYFTARQVESITSTGFPITYDELSYGGRSYTGSPVFYYLLGFFNLFLPLAIVGKVVMNLLASSLVIVVYLAAYEFSKSRNAALFSSFISGFIPVFFSSTSNSLSVYSVAFPLLFLCAYFFLRIEKENYIYFYLISMLLLTMLSPIVILLLIGFVFYILLLKLDRMKQSRAELEVMVFSIFFVTWFLFIVYKKAFLFHGYSVIWQNIPVEILKNYFGEITILGAIYQIGTIPLLYAAYAILQHIYRPKYRTSCFFGGFAFSTVLLLWLRLIEPYLGLTCLGIISVLLFAQFYKWSFQYWKHTHFAKFRSILFLSFLVSIVLTSVIPSLSLADRNIKGAIDDDEFAVLQWISMNAEENATVLAQLSHGHYITGIAKRKNIADDNFFMIKSAEERYIDIGRIYTAMFETEALNTLNKYGIKYIILPPQTRSRYGIDSLAYASESKCFELIYNSTTLVYESRCRLKQL